MIYKPEFADQARAMCRLGATDEELADHFQVCVRTIYRWRNTHEEFAEAVVAGKDQADDRVERALYSRAVGCSVQRTKVFKHAGDPDPVYATYTHHLPPDPNAALQWLRVRQPKKWGAHAEDEGDPGVYSIIQAARARVTDYKPAYWAPSGGPPEAATPEPDPEPDADLDPDPQPGPAPELHPEPEPAPEPEPNPEPVSVSWPSGRSYPAADQWPAPPPRVADFPESVRANVYAPVYAPITPKPWGSG
jgi:hypothetical protein